jgi:hypothetical protein
MTRAGTQQPVTALAHGQRPGHLPRLRLTPSGAPAAAAGQPTPRPRDAWSRTRWWRRCEVTAKLTAKPHDNRQRASAVPAGRVGLVLSSPLIAGALRERQQQVGPISWPAPGRPSCGCAAACGSSSAASTSPTSRWSPPPGSLPGSWGPRCSSDLYAAGPGGGRRSARPHPPVPGPVRAPPTQGKIPATLPVTPRTARRIKSGAPGCTQPTCGPDPRTSAWRSGDPRRSDAVLANRSPAPPRPASTTGNTRSRSPAAPTDGAVP